MLKSYNCSSVKITITSILTITTVNIHRQYFIYRVLDEQNNLFLPKIHSALCVSAMGPVDACLIVAFLPLINDDVGCAR